MKNTHLKTRILSLALAVLTVLSVLPALPMTIFTFLAADDTCTCETKCTEGSVNSNCLVCIADLNDCITPDEPTIPDEPADVPGVPDTPVDAPEENSEVAPEEYPEDNEASVGNRTDSDDADNAASQDSVFDDPASYDVIIAETTNGTVTASPASAAEGETVTLTVTPAKGYRLGRLIVTNTVDTSEVADVSASKSFEMPAAAVTVNAVFVACNHEGSTHTKYTSNNDGTHGFTCTICGGTGSEAHSGGSPTCTTSDECTVCGSDYLNPDNHEYVNSVCSCGAIAPIEKNANGIYEIYVPKQLVEFAQIVNGTHATIPQDKAANAILKADINMDGIEWTPICSTALYYSNTYSGGAYPDAGYAGTFDGDGYVIKNLSVTGSSTEDISFGLFGTVSGTVKNLGMENFTYTGAGKDTRVGSIVGQLIGGTVENCYAVGSTINTQVNTTNGVAGGIAGCNYGGTVANCYVYNLTMAAGRSGGVVGDNRSDTEGDRVGTMTNCYTNYGNYVGSYTGTQMNCDVCLERRFASGEVTYLLGGAWKQSTLPVLRGGDTVYENTCGGDVFYSTTDTDYDAHAVGSDYLCTNCKNYEPATLVTADNCGNLGLDESYVGYYAIKNASNLYWYAQQERIGDISGSIVLLNDLTLDNSKAMWIPIGWDGGCTFDGRGHTVTLKLDYGTEQGSAAYGLFGTCNYSVIKNLFLDGYITANTTGNMGAVAASMYRTTISGVISTVNVTNICTTGGNVGGLVGYFGGKHSGGQYSKIENCAVYANVTGYIAGGLVGQGWNGTQYWDITNAAYIGNVTTTDTANGMAGAIVGYQATDTNTSTFTNVYWCEQDGLGFYGGRDTENQVYTNTSAKTAEQFASGEVAWLLNASSADGAWKQTLGSDSVPGFTGKTVYYVESCTAGTSLYSNVNESGAHLYNKEGVCTLCGETKLALGDVDGNGEVDISDVTVLLSYLADTSVVLKGNGDIDGSAAIDISDVTVLLSILAGN